MAPLLGFVSPSDPVELLAELGIFFVMFHTGMEMDPKELLEHIWPSLGVAVGGFILPFVLCALTTYAFGGNLYQSLFVGMGVSITAIAVRLRFSGIAGGFTYLGLHATLIERKSRVPLEDPVPRGEPRLHSPFCLRSIRLFQWT